MKDRKVTSSGLAGWIIGCFIGSILIWSSTAFADDPPVGWGTKIWPPVPIELELPSFCSAFAMVPEEDRFLAGFHDGRVLSVSLPDGEWTEIAKFDAEVRTIAFDPYTSSIGVITSDRKSNVTSVAIVPPSGDEPVVIDQRLAPGLAVCSLRWSPNGRYLAALVDASFNTWPAWMMIDASAHRVIHELNPAKRFASLGHWSLDERQYVAFGKDDSFFAVTNNSRRSTVAYFEIRPATVETTTASSSNLVCERIDAVTVPGYVETFFDAGSHRISILLSRSNRNSGLQYFVNDCQFVQNHLTVSPGPFMPGIGVERVIAGGRNAAGSLWTMTRIIAGPHEQRCILEAFESGRFKELSRSSCECTSDQVFRVNPARAVATYVGTGAMHAILFVDMDGTYPAERLDLGLHQGDQLTGDFCGKTSQFFVTVNVADFDPTKSPFPVTPTKLRVWKLTQ